MRQCPAEDPAGDLCAPIGIGLVRRISIGGEAFFAGSRGGRSKSATAIMPATVRRDKRVDQRSKVDQTTSPLGRSLLWAKTLSLVPKVAATTPLAVRAADKLQNV